MRFVWLDPSVAQQISCTVNYPGQGAAHHRGNAPVATEDQAQERPLGETEPHQTHSGQDAKRDENTGRDGAGAAQHQLQQEHGDEMEIEQQALVPDVYMDGLPNKRFAALSGCKNSKCGHTCPACR